MSRILIVEDEDVMADMLRDVLVGEGHEVFEAYNGEDGLKLLVEKRPEVVLLDLMLPILDGPGFLAAMQKDPALRGTPVIAMTSAGLTHQERGQFAAFLPKPFKLDDLLRVLARVVPPRR
jgi:CheY-like chemotaxis protein